MTSNHDGPFKWAKRSLVGIIGRDRANRIAGPYHDWRARRHTRAFLADLPKGDLCVNLGCGYRPMKGWINVDRARSPEVQVVWNLAEGLPFPDSTCAAIFSEHVIEHISKEHASRLLGECYRVLQPGGVLRISTPDAERFLRSYAGDGEFLRHPAFDEPIETPLDRINQMMREYGQHLWVYDAESLILRLRKVGFSSAFAQQYRVSAHPRMQDIDSAEREFESLYVEAIK
ncbi:MAG TPA: methyltransferase domain-containing protein [Pyrinomonadaceae bacterium]|nr:methyltransferase domain-containing protein [Pyrinomonadaceae bacterium]